MSGSAGNWELEIPDVRARIVPVLQDGRDLIPEDSFSVASGDGVDDWVRSSSSSQMGAICEGSGHGQLCLMYHLRWNICHDVNDGQRERCYLSYIFHDV